MAENSTLNVSAAISMKDSLLKIKERYEHENPGVAINFNFASSGTLQQQLEQGAPVDVFISAGQKQMTALEKKKLVGLSREVAGNELVLIIPAAANRAITGVEQLADPAFEKIAIGNPDTVPAGKYAEEALKNKGVLSQIKPKTVLAKDVRQVLAYVATGDVDAGFVYRTDANTLNKVKISYVVSSTLHSPIVYPAAVVETSANKVQAGHFIEFLCSDEATAVFEQYGFSIP